MATARLRRVEYKCPETLNKYTSITTEWKPRPGVIAWLYFSRWRIEKVFDVFERKLGQDNAWVTDEHDKNAAPCQPEFICMGYSILLFMQSVLATRAGIKDLKSEEKRRMTTGHRRSYIVLGENLELGSKGVEGEFPPFASKR